MSKIWGDKRDKRYRERDKTRDGITRTHAREGSIDTTEPMPSSTSEEEAYIQECAVLLMNGNTGRRCTG